MHPRFKPLAIEITITVAIFLLLFQGGILPSDLSNPYVLLVVGVFIAEFIRILYKLRRLRLEGVDIDDEGLKSPVLYGASSKLGNFDYQWKKNTKPIYWIIGIVFSLMALVVVTFIILAVLSQFGLISLP